ncbi:MAG: sugar ABC transporter permease [Ktedonobacteraceae bacterium]|nr:sugar ABC transporter permease [Ktedonobacteraceae bacterium]
MSKTELSLPVGNASGAQHLKQSESAVVRSRRKTRNRRTKELLTMAVLLLPALGMLLLFRLLPALYAFAESFLHNGAFAGWGNYSFLFQSASFWGSLRTTLLFSIIINPVQIICSLLLAVLLTQKLPGTSIWRTLIFLPVTIPFISSAIVWSVAFRPDGILNALLSTLHLPPQPFLTSPAQALYCIMILASWIGVGYWMMFLIAGLREIPDMYREAAAIDGAGTLRTFFQIVLPLLRRPLAFVLVADTVANFLLFAPIQALTRGGPDDSTNLIMFDIFRQGYTFGDFGLAEAEVSVLVVVMLIVVLLQFKLLQSD